MKYVGYAWSALGWGVFALIVRCVLDQLHSRPEALIVPILGIMYCAQVSSANATMAMLRGVDMRVRMKQPGDAGSFPTTELDALEAQAISAAVKYYIASFGLAAISLQCLWKLYTVLSPQLSF
jgi:hypothetical protein